jgi:hypothetical protein
MLAGITLATWFKSEAIRICAELATAEEDSGRAFTEKVIEWIVSNGGAVSPRALQRRFPSKFKTAYDANEFCDTLRKAGHGTWGNSAATGKPGRPGRALKLYQV